jgi:hypothetical protein
MTSGIALGLHDAVNGKGEFAMGVERAPFTMAVTISGIAPILFHRWDCAAVEAKSKAKKNSREKKEDNLESYVYRCADGTLGLPGMNLHMALAQAGKSKADPRSPRKSAYELVKAALLVTPTVASFGATTWDYEDRRRVVVQRNGVTRVRPAMREGWTLSFEVTVVDSAYVDEPLVYDLLATAGRYNGLGDFRPQFGRFNVVQFTRVNFGA